MLMMMMMMAMNECEKKNNKDVVSFCFDSWRVHLTSVAAANMKCGAVAQFMLTLYDTIVKKN